MLPGQVDKKVKQLDTHHALSHLSILLATAMWRTASSSSLKSVQLVVRMSAPEEFLSYSLIFYVRFRFCTVQISILTMQRRRLTHSCES